MDIWDMKEKCSNSEELKALLISTVDAGKPFERKVANLIKKMKAEDADFYEDCSSTYWADSWNSLIDGYI